MISEWRTCLLNPRVGQHRLDGDFVLRLAYHWVLVPSHLLQRMFISCRGCTAVKDIRGAQRANYALKEERSVPSLARHVIRRRGVYATALIDCLQVEHEAREEDDGETGSASVGEQDDKRSEESREDVHLVEVRPDDPDCSLLW